MLRVRIQKHSPLPCVPPIPIPGWREIPILILINKEGNDESRGDGTEEVDTSNYINLGDICLEVVILNIILVCSIIIGRSVSDIA